MKTSIKAGLDRLASNLYEEGELIYFLPGGNSYAFLIHSDKIDLDLSPGWIPSIEYFHKLAFEIYPELKHKSEIISESGAHTLILDINNALESPHYYHKLSPGHMFYHLNNDIRR